VRAQGAGGVCFQSMPPTCGPPWRCTNVYNSIRYQHHTDPRGGRSYIARYTYASVRSICKGTDAGMRGDFSRSSTTWGPSPFTVHIAYYSTPFATPFSRCEGAAPFSRLTSPASTSSYFLPISSFVASCTSPGRSCCISRYCTNGWEIDVVEYLLRLYASGSLARASLGGVTVWRWRCGGVAVWRCSCVSDTARALR
jgi:hypothetical protein